MATRKVKIFPSIYLFCALVAGCFAIGCAKKERPDEVFANVRQKMQHGDFDKALQEVDEAYREYSGKNAEWACEFRILKAQVLVHRGATSQAQLLLNENIPATLTTSDAAARRRMVQGLVHDLAQQYDAAELDFLEAENLARSSQPGLLGDVEQAKGGLELERGKFPEADTSFRAALSIARQRGFAYGEANALGGLGNLSMEQGRFDQAIDFFNEAIQIAIRLNMQSLVAKGLGNMGWSYFELGDYENALSYYQQGMEYSLKSGLVADRNYWLTEVAKAQFALRNFTAAEDVLGGALTLARQQDDKRILTECLNQLTRVALGTGQLRLAQKYNQEAVDTERAGLDQSGIPDTKMLTARIRAANREFEPAKSLFQEIIADSNSDPALRWEAQAQLAKMYEDEQLPTEADYEFAHSLGTIQTARASIQDEELRLSFLSSSISFYGDYIDFLILRGKSNDALRVAEQSRAWTLEEGLGSSTKTAKFSPTSSQPQQLARRLHATLFFYWLGEQHSYLWVITPAKTTCITLPAASEIDAAVKSYRDAVANSKDVAETEQPAGEKLYETLVTPAQKLIPQNSRVILLPDGSLYSLNFETLIVPGAKPHFWIEDVTLTTASSLSLLASGANRAPPKQKNLLMVGDALKANEEFEPLPQAEEEMQDVEHYFAETNRTVLKREQATPAAYLASNPERYAYLHFVTHGTASRAQPLESAVILSKEPASDTYKLYARDIVKRHLNAELVTISACNGSGKRTYSGEGLVGLSWAFLRAGAHNVVGALWEVSNAPSTGQLMDVFYKGLSQGEDPATALREAKLSFLRSTDSKSVFKKPYYWAPFQLYAGS